jgi:hypothetical protein
MAQMYGHRWVSAYGETYDAQGELSETAKMWKSGLAGLTPQQIARGLEQCMALGDDWPPSLPKFRALCLEKQAGDPHSIHAAAYKQPECLALPKPRPSREKVRPYLQALWRVLKRGR